MTAHSFHEIKEIKITKEKRETEHGKYSIVKIELFDKNNVLSEHEVNIYGDPELMVTNGCNALDIQQGKPPPPGSDTSVAP